MNTTLGTLAATIWFRRPWASRKSRPSGVSGTRPRPTSLDTSTTGYFAAPRKRVSRRASTSGSRFAHIGRLSRQRIDQRQRFLDGDPAIATLRTVIHDTISHLVIISGRRGKVNPRESAIADHLFGKSGFAGARAPQHQRGSQRCHFGALPSSGDQHIGGTRATMPLRSTSARSRHGTRP